jgi:hypothetical protein
LRDRRAEAKALEKAAKILDRHRAALQILTPWVRISALPSGLRNEERFLYPRGEDLRWVAALLRAIPPRPGAPAKWHVRAAARGLAALVERTGGDVVPEEIGGVLRAAWPSARIHHDEEADARAGLAARSRTTEEMLLLTDGEETSRIGSEWMNLRVPPFPRRVPATPPPTPSRSAPRRGRPARSPKGSRSRRAR